MMYTSYDEINKGKREKLDDLNEKMILENVERKKNL